ncbi:MAG: hypothetical protein IJD04_00525 [Desulfovibrionaceae bacterium]|nr:hypothetical protein [Desulfovibrionaceae bacterium]
MRIGQYSGSAAGRQDDNNGEQRRQAFRKRYALGQEVEGILSENPEGGLAWVNVGGLELTAKIPFQGRKGQRLLLQIMQLEPEIVLKFLKALHTSAEAVQIQNYAASRSRCELEWQDFLQRLTAEEAVSITPAADFPDLDPDSPLPEAIIEQGELQVKLLHQLFHKNFLNSGRQAGLFSELEKIQQGHVKAAHSSGSGVCAWACVPWSGWAGIEKEMMIMRREGQRLDEVFFSGVWPELGPVFIKALALDGKISYRISSRSRLPFGQLVMLLNLGGLGEALRQVKQRFGLAAWPQTSSSVCLEYRQGPADSVTGMLLRLQRWDS